jgi:oligoribonuclease NrnB/cAMP/cGMP phosphodiesterase (DHH superfamily)
MGTPALLIRNYCMPPRNIFFMQQKDFGLLLNHIKKLNPKESTFIIGDLSLNDDQISYVKEMISRLKRNGNTVIWLDHHPWSEKGIKAIREVDFGVSGENELYSAAQLAYMLFCKRDRENKLLSDMIHVSDFALKSRRFGRTNEKLTGAIMSFRWKGSSMQSNLQRLASIIARLDFSNPFVERAYRSYLKASKGGIARLKANTYIAATSPYRIAVGFSKRLHTNQACGIIAKRCRSDIEVYVDIETGKSGVRSRKGVDCSLIASALNGGGHPQASGFVLDPKRFGNFDGNGRKRFVERIKNLSKEAYRQ